MNHSGRRLPEKGAAPSGTPVSSVVDEFRSISRNVYFPRIV
jgi:hypothetical protein